MDYGLCKARCGRCRAHKGSLEGLFQQPSEVEAG